MSNVLSDTVYAGEAGLRNVAHSLPGDMDGPFGFYHNQNSNIRAISSAGSMLANIARQQGGPNFGAGLQFTYSPEERFKLMAGVQGNI